MIINSLEKMEQLVSKHSNLFWDGWTVVERVKSDKARTSKHGIYLNGIWYMQKSFMPDRNGWTIPSRYSA